MKSEEVDQIVSDIFAEHKVSRCLLTGQVTKLAIALKSALADSERIDALEKDVRLNENLHPQLVVVLEKDQTLRQAIDERRKA